jgi:hypothetical protein
MCGSHQCKAVAAVVILCGGSGSRVTALNDHYGRCCMAVMNKNLLMVWQVVGGNPGS